MDKEQTEKIDTTDLTNVRSFLKTAGLEEAKIDEVVGKEHDNRSRKDLADQLKTWLRDRPKGRV